MSHLFVKIPLAIIVCVMMAGCEEPDRNVFPPGPKAKTETSLEPGPADADAPQEFTKTESGLKYRILRKSEGKRPEASDRVKVHYRGTLDDGKIFDSSYGKTGNAVEFNLNGVIPGWTEGLQQVGEGGMIELEIPSELGYGHAGMGKAIPPDATLHFIVELISVK